MKKTFLVMAILGFVLAALDIWVGNLGWAFFLIVCSSINAYNFIMWDVKMAALQAKHEALVKEYDDAKTERQRKIDELYGK